MNSKNMLIQTEGLLSPLTVKSYQGHSKISIKFMYVSTLNVKATIDACDIPSNYCRTMRK